MIAQTETEIAATPAKYHEVPKPIRKRDRQRKARRREEALCTEPATRQPREATRKPTAGQRRPRAPQLLQEALCTAPATQKAARKLSVLRLPRESEPRASLPSISPQRPCRHFWQPSGSPAHDFGHLPGAWLELL